MFQNSGDDFSVKVNLVTGRHFGFLGSGKMAQAISRGLLSCGLLKGSQVTMTDCFSSSPEYSVLYEPIRQMKELYGIEYLQNNPQMVQKSDVIFVCVKPNYVQSVLSECIEVIENKLVISIAAGISISDIEEAVADSTHVIRVMPNTPCLVQQGAAIFSRGTRTTDEDVQVLKAMFSVISPVLEEIPESLMNSATAISGCGPAYIFMVMEALADGGVRLGLSRAISQKLAIQTVLGTAILARDSGIHMAQLRDDVCSPGGSTIAGTHVLERAGIRAAFSDCVEAAKKRNDELASKKN